jgi:hypothetical protein
MTGYPWETSMGPEGRPEIARDGSEVRLLVRTSDASVVHCTLPAGATSRATRNLGINEIWIIMAGQRRTLASEGQRGSGDCAGSGRLCHYPEWDRLSVPEFEQ